jgi:hypothetical protein
MVEPGSADDFKQLTELMEGTIDVGAVGKGSGFWFTAAFGRATAGAAGDAMMPPPAAFACSLRNTNSGISVARC